MNPDNVTIVISEKLGPAAFPKPRRVLVGRAEPGPDGAAPAVIGPLGVLKLYEAVQKVQLEHLTAVARTIAADLHAQLAEVPGERQCDAMIVEAGHLVDELERIRDTVRRDA